MSWFRHRDPESKEACKHEGALPRWDNVDDTGQMDKVSRFYCPKCDRFVSPSERQAQAPSPSA